MSELPSPGVNLALEDFALGKASRADELTTNSPFDPHLAEEMLS